MSVRGHREEGSRAFLQASWHGDRRGEGGFAPCDIRRAAPAFVPGEKGLLQLGRWQYVLQYHSARACIPHAARLESVTWRDLSTHEPMIAR